MKKKKPYKIGWGYDKDRGRGLGEKKETPGFNPLWFLAGGVVGAGLWMLFSKATAPVGQTQAALLPTVAPPSRFANLESVAIRLDQVKTLYRSGRLSPEQALAELEGLSAAANSFSAARGEAVSDVIAAIETLKDEIRNYIELQRRGIVGPSA